MFGFGVVNLILALFFHEIGFSDDQIGFFMSMTLWGDVLLSLILTLVADHIGRRRILILGSLLMLGSGVAFALSGIYWILLLAAVLGVISVSGSEIGPFRAIEESTLAHLTVPDTRAYVLTWYVVLANFGSAIGIGVCGLFVDHLQDKLHWTPTQSYHAVFWIYATVGALNTLLSFALSSQCEIDPKPARSSRPTDTAEAADLTSETRPLLDNQVLTEPDGTTEDGGPTKKTKKRSVFTGLSKETQWTLFRLGLLFFMDSFASGMVPFSLINYYVDGKFRLPKARLGEIMSVTWLFSAISNIFSGSIAKRIGLIKAMVFTHLPSAVFLALLPVPSSLTITILLLFARACLNSMDQAPRAAFISAVVKPEERTTVMGIINVLKTLSQSAGPWTTGGLAEHNLFWVAFVVAGSLKGTYDILLLIMFINARLDKHEQPQQDHGLGQETGDQADGEDAEEREQGDQRH
jgi:MFS family permease